MLHGLEFIPSNKTKDLESPLCESALGKVKPEEIYALVTDKIIELIESGKELAWQKQWTTKNKTGLAATNYVSKKAYRGINSFMLNLIYPLFYNRVFKSPYFLTFKQVTKLKGRVKKGSEGIPVFYYTFIRKNKGVVITDTEYERIQKACRESKSNEECEKLSQFAVIKYYNVFSADDVEGIDFKLPNTSSPQTENEKIEVCESIIEYYPSPQPKIIFKDPEGAYYIPSKDVVNMPEIGSFKNAQSYYSTKFHELAHSTGAKSRLGRDMSGKFGSKSYAFEELIAELCASYLNAESGILYFNLRNSAAYLKGWKKRLLTYLKEDNKFFMHAASAAQKAADFILQYNEAGIPLYAQKIPLPKNIVATKSKKQASGQQMQMELAGTESPARLIVKEYLALDGAKVSKSFLRAILDKLQCRVKDGSIRKEDPFAPEIERIQNQLIKAVNNSGSLFFIKLSNKKYYEDKLKDGLGFINFIIKAVASQAVQDKVEKMLRPKEKKASTLGKLKKETKVIEPVGSITDELFTRADQRNEIVVPGTYRLQGEIGKFLGEIQPYQFAIALEGESHAGKTEMLMQLLNAFAGIKKSCALFSLEQGGLQSKDTLQSIDRNITKENQKLISVAGEAVNGIETIEQYAQKFDVIAIDSWQVLELPGTKFNKLREKYPDKIWIVIFQQNADGGTKGGASPGYSANVHLIVHRVDHTFVNNYVQMKKNRNNPSTLGLKYMWAKKKCAPAYEAPKKKVVEKEDSNKQKKVTK